MCCFLMLTALYVCRKIRLSVRLGSVGPVLSIQLTGLLSSCCVENTFHFLSSSDNLTQKIKSESMWHVPFKLRPKDRKGAPLCRYTGVTRKVPFKLRPKDRRKVSIGYCKKCRAPRGNKNRGFRGIEFEKTETD